VRLKNKRGEYYFLDLFKASQTPIRRHIKIRAEANLYDPKYTEYFFERERLKLERYTKAKDKPKPDLNASNIKHLTAGSCIHGFRKA
jgi:hypothetical protein